MTAIIQTAHKRAGITRVHDMIRVVGASGAGRTFERVIDVRHYEGTKTRGFVHIRTAMSVVDVHVDDAVEIVAF